MPEALWIEATLQVHEVQQLPMLLVLIEQPVLQFRCLSLFQVAYGLIGLWDTQAQQQDLIGLERLLITYNLPAPASKQGGHSLQALLDAEAASRLQQLFACMSHVTAIW